MDNIFSIKNLRINKTKPNFTLAEDTTCVDTPPRYAKPGFTLAEGTTCVDTPPRYAKPGFTLAEVLITLSIVGIVAAMTIPNLITKIQGNQYRAKFKKAISTLSQAGRISLNQYDFDYAGINSTCGENGQTENPEEVHTICALLNGTLKGTTYTNTASELKMKDGTPYTITAVKTTGWGISNTDKAISIILPDATMILVGKSFGKYNCTLETGKILTEVISNTTLAHCNGYIDINGVEGPNKEVDCSSGENDVSKQTCVVKNHPNYLTDIYPVRFHDSIVEPATAAAKYVLNSAK